jgi:hypothetical protein
MFYVLLKSKHEHLFLFLLLFLKTTTLVVGVSAKDLILHTSFIGTYREKSDDIYARCIFFLLLQIHVITLQTSRHEDYRKSLHAIYDIPKLPWPNVVYLIMFGQTCEIRRIKNCVGRLCTRVQLICTFIMYIYFTSPVDCFAAG